MKSAYRANHPAASMRAKDVDSATPVSFLTESRDDILLTTSPLQNQMLNFYKKIVSYKGYPIQPLEFFSKHEKEFSIISRVALGVLVITPSFAEVELPFPKVV
jgi:hypothetical protein